MNTDPKDRLKQIVETTIESGLKFTGSLDKIDYYSMLCKCTASNQLYKIFSCNLIMMNYNYENEESVLIIFAIPSSIENNGNSKENKHISERTMEILKLIEDCFITVDYMDLQNVKEDKFSYMTIVKKIKNEE